MRVCMLIDVPKASLWHCLSMGSACRGGKTTGRGGFGVKPLGGISAQSLTLYEDQGRWWGGLEEVISRCLFQPQTSVIL